jgi:predicted ester cyclase
VGINGVGGHPTPRILRTGGSRTGRSEETKDSQKVTAFPDLVWTTDEQIVEGDKVVTRFTWTGTHRSEFLEIWQEFFSFDRLRD